MKLGDSSGKAAIVIFLIAFFLIPTHTIAAKLNTTSSGNSAVMTGSSSVSTAVTSSTAFGDTVPLTGVSENIFSWSAGAGYVNRKISLDKLIFLTANRQIKLLPQGDTVIDLAGLTFTVGIAKIDLPPNPVSVTLEISGDRTYPLVRQAESDYYYADLYFPAGGPREANVKINYGNNQVDAIKFNLLNAAPGRVMSNSKSVGDVSVTIFTSDGSPVHTGIFGQTNPIQSGANGTFAWMVPNGDYYLSAAMNSYFTRQTPIFTVKNNIVNNAVDLIEMPPPLNLNIKNISQFAKIISMIGLQSAGDIAVAIRREAANPEVQKIAAQIVAPVAAVVAAINTVAAVPAADAIPFLQLVFLQPWIYVGKWIKRGVLGIVYNSQDKLPVPLATVHLVSNDNGKVVQTRITDQKGRYAFFITPGNYHLEVKKNSFSFPSALLKGVKVDGEKSDIYQGEVFAISDKNFLISANVPLDPSVDLEKPISIVVQRALVRLRFEILILCLLVNVGALLIAPHWYLWILLGVSLAFFAVLNYFIALNFRARSPKAASADNTSKPPVETDSTGSKPGVFGNLT